MSEFVRVASVGEIEPGQFRTVDVSGLKVIVYNVDGTLYATGDTCLHQEGPLDEGTLEGALIECPWHGWRYDVKTGACVDRPAASVPCYEVRVEGDDVKVAVNKTDTGW